MADLIHAATLTERLADFMLRYDHAGTGRPGWI